MECLSNFQVRIELCRVVLIVNPLYIYISTCVKKKEKKYFEIFDMDTIEIKVSINVRERIDIVFINLTRAN